MNINLHIERLILDGLPMEAKHGAAVRKAIEAELSWLFTRDAGLSAWQNGGAVPRLHGADIALPAQGTPAQYGKEIAGSIYGGINKEI